MEETRDPDELLNLIRSHLPKLPPRDTFLRAFSILASAERVRPPDWEVFHYSVIFHRWGKPHFRRGRTISRGWVVAKAYRVPESDDLSSGGYDVDVFLATSLQVWTTRLNYVDRTVWTDDRRGHLHYGLAEIGTELVVGKKESWGRMGATVSGIQGADLLSERPEDAAFTAALRILKLV